MRASDMSENYLLPSISVCVSLLFPDDPLQRQTIDLTIDCLRSTIERCTELKLNEKHN